MAALSRAKPQECASLDLIDLDNATTLRSYSRDKCGIGQSSRTLYVCTMFMDN